MSTPYQAQLIKADGTTEDIAPESGEKFTLEELQKYVGGYIEAHALPDGRLIILNEDGMSMNLPVNHLATVLAYNLSTFAGILGDVVVCPETMFD